MDTFRTYVKEAKFYSEPFPWTTERVLFSATMTELNFTFADFTELGEEQSPVVQESWDCEAEGEQSYWRDTIDHMSDNWSSFTNQSLIWSSNTKTSSIDDYRSFD